MKITKIHVLKILEAVIALVFSNRYCTGLLCSKTAYSLDQLASFDSVLLLSL